MRTILVAAAVGAVACTSVKMVQRDGCWLKRTEKTLGGDKEELGFCAKPEPVPAEDRMARLVQECMAQADYRWQNRAIAAWNRGEPIPAQDAEDAVAKTCLGQAAAALGVEQENSALKARLAELSQDRESLKATSEKDREFLQQNSEKMVAALGEAAKRPSPNATATATSTTKSETEAAPPSTVVGFGAPATPVLMPRAAPAPRPQPVSSCQRKAPAPEKAAEPACPPPPSKQQAKLDARQSD